MLSAYKVSDEVCFQPWKLKLEIPELRKTFVLRVAPQNCWRVEEHYNLSLLVVLKVFDSNPAAAHLGLYVMILSKEMSFDTEAHIWYFRQIETATS